MNEELILAIESSCDETSVAVVRNGTEILSNIVASQINSHKRFGGVVPEVASRHHVEQITLCLEDALVEAGVSAEDLSAVAVTYGPGLVGSLLIGISAAKAFAWAHQLPLIPVNHMAGHIYAARLVKPFQFPLMALLVSGGHTELVYMQEDGSYEIIGETRDDAAGEAYDKVGRVLAIVSKAWSASSIASAPPQPCICSLMNPAVTKQPVASITSSHIRGQKKRCPIMSRIVSPSYKRTCPDTISRSSTRLPLTTAFTAFTPFRLCLRTTKINAQVST